MWCGGVGVKSPIKSVPVCLRQVEVSQKLLTYGASILNELIATELGKVTIPDISGEKDGFNYDVHNCKLAATISSPSAAFVAGQGLSVALNGINLQGAAETALQGDVA